MEKRFFTYAIQSMKDGRIYVGMSYRPDIRLREHNSGRVSSTRYYRPWNMIYCVEFETRMLARKEEKRLKSGYGKEFLKNISHSGVAQW
jgi:putative endonuclease